MFSFHKPKIYRSNLGCCICKAKSSSSRFTDSKKYENEFEQCFRLKEKRSGEICNACVLLVKRWKKLSHENRLTKHWHHVVDARAGPGTKLTGNRRLTSPSTSQQRSSSNNSNDVNEGQNFAKNNRPSNRGTDVLPLSCNQVTNQPSGSGRMRSLSKVCAIDTNVSTFTFGEPITNINRTRSYTSAEPSYSGSIATSSSSSFKPQSALNSSAFESVIKRFRQRQQQQHLEAQRRKQSRQQRAQQRNSLTQRAGHMDSKALSGESGRSDANRRNTAKRAQRYPSGENAAGINNVLDSSIWRREKICCGVIYRGLYNEIAIIPRLMNPCQCRLNATRTQTVTDKDGKNVAGNALVNDNVSINEEDDCEEQVPPPRATKSGSISSCDSNTSGCGSMEEANAEGPVTIVADARRNRRPINESPRKRRRLEEGKQLEVCSPSGSSSGNSSSQLVASQDDDEDEVDDDDVEHGMIIGGELLLEVSEASTSDSSNDATSSSVESLNAGELESKGTDALAFG